MSENFYKAFVANTYVKTVENRADSLHLAIKKYKYQTFTDTSQISETYTLSNSSIIPE